MKKLFVLTVLIFLFFTSCNSQNINPKDYFPLDIGREWHYQITLNESETVLGFREIFWPIGDGDVAFCYNTTQYFYGKIGETYSLVLKVKEKAEKQGERFQWPNGVRIEVLEDELNLFRGTEEIFWATTGGIAGQRFMAQQVITYPGYDSPTQGYQEGYSTNLIFFFDEPYTSIGMGEDPVDRLFFIGPDPYYDDGMGFVRTVYLEEDTLLTEAIRFKKGKVLDKLVQVVDEKTTMEWNLIKTY